MSKFVLALLMFVPLVRADFLLGTISWPVSGTSDSPPPETCQIDFIIVGLADQIPFGTPCGTIDHASWGAIFDHIAARLTNGVDNRIGVAGLLSLDGQPDSAFAINESQIPRGPGIHSTPDFIGYSVDRIVAGPEITDAHMINCLPTIGCQGWSFIAVNHFSIYGNVAAVPEGTPYFAVIPALIFAIRTRAWIRRAP